MIASTITLIGRHGGPCGSKLTAASTVAVGARLPRLHCHMTVPLATPTGKLAGLQRKNNGAANMLKRVAQQPPAFHMIAMLAFWTGRKVGRISRKSGVAIITTVAAKSRLRLPSCHLTAMLASQAGHQVGPRANKAGVAVTPRKAALLHLRRRFCLMTVMRASTIGRLGGLTLRKSGVAAGSAADVRKLQHLCLMIARPATLTGKQLGQIPRNNGVACMSIVDAQQQALQCLTSATLVMRTGSAHGHPAKSIGAAPGNKRPVIHFTVMKDSKTF